MSASRHSRRFRSIDRIAAADEHNRYGRSGSPDREHGGIWAGDHGHLALDQIGRECRQPIELVLRPPKFDRDVVAVDEPGFLQAITKYRYPVNGIGSRGGIKETDHRYRRSLRARCERPRNSAAGERKELASPDIDCHATLPGGVMPMRRRGRYHALFARSVTFTLRNSDYPRLARLPSRLSVIADMPARPPR